MAWRGGAGSARQGKLGRVGARRGRHGGLVKDGVAWQARPGRQALEGSDGKSRPDWLGVSGRSKWRPGRLGRRGWLVAAGRRVTARMARLGGAGITRRGWAGRQGPSWQGPDGSRRRGREARPGKARYGWPGAVRLGGTARLGVAGAARAGAAGMTGHGGPRRARLGRRGWASLAQAWPGWLGRAGMTGHGRAGTARQGRLGPVGRGEEVPARQAGQG